MNVGDLCPFCGQEFLSIVLENPNDAFSSEHLACGLCNSTYPYINRMIKPVREFSLKNLRKSDSRTFGIIFSDKNQKGEFLQKLKSQNLGYKISHFAGGIFELRFLDKIVVELKRTLYLHSICGWRVQELFVDINENDKNSEEFRNFIKPMISIKPPLNE